MTERPAPKTMRRPAVHYLDIDPDRNGTRKTPCGVLCFRRGTSRPGLAVTGDYHNMEFSPDIDRVTCKRCIASWNAFVKRGG